MKISGWKKIGTKKTKDRWYSPKYGYMWIEHVVNNKKLPQGYYAMLNDKAKIKPTGFNKKINGVWVAKFPSHIAARKFAVAWMKKHPII